MNVQKLTQKSIEAVQTAQQTAAEHHNAQVQQIHLLDALLSQNDGLIPSMLNGMGADTKQMAKETESLIRNLPSVQGDRVDVYLSRDLDNAFNEADKTAQSMGDAYISVEHLFIGLIKKADRDVKSLLGKYSVTLESFMDKLKNVRGNRKVDSDSPESTYDVLKKYGQDLVELARNQKLDPVIGRDDEIRNVIMILSRKTKNNPCLIGEPGVGKTAIAEGLAQRIVR